MFSPFYGREILHIQKNPILSVGMTRWMSYIKHTVTEWLGW